MHLQHLSGIYCYQYKAYIIATAYAIVLHNYFLESSRKLLLYVSHNWLPKMLLQHNSGATDLHNKFLRVFFLFSICHLITYIKNKGIFSDSKDHRPLSFDFCFLFYLLSNCICKSVLERTVTSICDETVEKQCHRHKENQYMKLKT